MGTSTAYGGPSGRDPLVPSWLGSGGDSAPSGSSPDAPPGDHGQMAGPNGAPPPAAPPAPPRQPIPPAANPNRYTGPRGNFTRFARSGGSDRASLGRAVSQYVSSSAGGSRQAVQRMGTSRVAGARLVGFLNDAQTRGAREALRTLNLEALAGRPLPEILIGLADHVCPGTGTVDEGIAREAYVETVVELTTSGITDLDALTPDQMLTVFEMYATHAIEARICNDIGLKAITMPSDAQAALRVEAQLRDFVRNGVSDALANARAGGAVLASDRIQGFVDQVYEDAFRFLHARGEAEGDQ
jgi:hypothetical protein